MSTAVIDRSDRQEQLALISDILEECRTLSKGTAVAVLHANWPSQSASFFDNRFDLIMSLSAEGMAHALGYSDPTGQRAVKQVAAERGF